MNKTVERTLIIGGLAGMLIFGPKMANEFHTKSQDKKITPVAQYEEVHKRRIIIEYGVKDKSLDLLIETPELRDYYMDFTLPYDSLNNLEDSLKGTSEVSEYLKNRNRSYASTAFFSLSLILGYIGLNHLWARKRGYKGMEETRPSETT
jgi:hypothetical protein